MDTLKRDEIQSPFLLFVCIEQLQHTTHYAEKHMQTYCHGNMTVLVFILLTHLCL